MFLPRQKLSCSRVGGKSNDKISDYIATAALFMDKIDEWEERIVFIIIEKKELLISECVFLFNLLCNVNASGVSSSPP